MSNKYKTQFCSLREHKIIINHFTGARYYTKEAVAGLLNKQAEQIAGLEQQLYALNEQDTLDPDRHER
jgi:hypothetical protein